MDHSLHYDYFPVPNQQLPSFAATRNEDFVRNYEYSSTRIPTYGQETSYVRHDAFGAPPYPLVTGPSLHEEDSADSPYWSDAKFAQESHVGLQVHAPIPVSGCAPILSSDAFHTDDAAPPAGRFGIPYAPAQYRAHSQMPMPEYPSVQRRISKCVSSPPPPMISQPTFLTPSELLVELSGQVNNAPQSIQQAHASSCNLHKISQLLSPQLSRPAITTATIPASSLFASPPYNSQSSETITSHEKKRHYLECLEQYIAFLHEHFRHVGIEPTPLERISNYRCLNSRSIRSLLIHMEKTTKQMQERIFKEEQKFLQLREALQRQQSVVEAAQGGHHGV